MDERQRAGDDALRWLPLKACGNRPGRGRQSDEIEQLAHARRRCAAGTLLTKVLDDVADHHARIKRGVGILKII